MQLWYMAKIPQCSHIPRKWLYSKLSFANQICLLTMIIFQKWTIIVAAVSSSILTKKEMLQQIEALRVAPKSHQLSFKVKRLRVGTTTDNKSYHCVTSRTQRYESQSDQKSCGNTKKYSKIVNFIHFIFDGNFRFALPK